jgi:hypothetical protein
MVDNPGALQDAQEVSLSLEQDNAIAVLRAKLKKADQNYNTDLAVVNLGERIQVMDGQFSFGVSLFSVRCFGCCTDRNPSLSTAYSKFGCVSRSH